MQPETKFAKSGDLFIAYQVVGHGPLDLVFAPAYSTHLELNWEWPPYARFLQRLASFSRLLLFDRRGTGLSDPAPVPSTLEQTMDDLRAVMDAEASEKAALFGWGEGGPMSALFAATYPERTSGLVLYASFAKGSWSPDFPWGMPIEMQETFLDILDRRWGRDVVAAGAVAPTVHKDEDFRRWLLRFQRSMSPGAAKAWFRMTTEIDVRHVLPAIRVPTLVLHRADDRMRPVGGSRFIAEQIPHARYVELPGMDNGPFVGDADGLVDEIQEFLTGMRPAPKLDRVLATVLFTDIVGSTALAAEVGDRRWRDLLDGYYAAVRKELDRFRGREVKTIGDGFLATFDGPARGIECARAIIEAGRALGIHIRAGLHTGECELMEGDVGGIAVHIGARVAALAEPGEVLVSSTVKDLVAGSGIEFDERGTHELRGVPGEWRLHAVGGPGISPRGRVEGRAR
jgi:class 3 adenylate cyclase/pimeloyl-ACP methyl ester carboxylesterase